MPGTPAGKGRSAPTAGDSTCGSSGDGPGRFHGVGGLRGLPRSAAGDVVPTDLPPLSSPDASSAVHAQTPSGATDLAHSGALFSRFLPDGEDRALQPGLAAGDRGSRPLGSRAGAGSSSSSLTGPPSPAARGSASLAPRRGRPAARRAGGRVRGDSQRARWVTAAPALLSLEPTSDPHR